MSEELIEVGVFSYEDPTELLEILDARLSPAAMEELRGEGGGDISVHIDDPKLVTNPTLLESRNVIRFKVGGEFVGGLIIDKKTTRIIEDDYGRRVYKISGPSFRGWLEDAAVYPQGGLRRSSYNERFFNFATARGDWYDEGQWTTPTNVVAWGDVVGSPWRYAPAEWPDVPLAKWVWSSDSISSAPEGDNFFRYEFTAAEDAKYSFFLAADDEYAMYIDGQLMEQSEPDVVAWSQVSRTDVDLPAGDHVFAVRVFNKANTPAGLIAAVFTYGDPAVPSSATLVSYTGKTGDTNWKVAGYPDPLPGWSPGEIVLTLLAEAEDRGVRFPLWLTPTFTENLDSYGNVWPRDLDWSFDVGSSLASVVERLEELVCDLWIDPATFELNMAIERGVDRSVYGYDLDGITVNRPILVFEEGKNLLQSSVDEVGEVKNSLLIQTTEGWITAQDDDSLSKYGTLEATLETGSSEAVSQAVATAVFETKANPEEGASYEIVPVEGHVPWKDFQVGDWVLAPDKTGLLVKRRVMSISVEEDDDTGLPLYTVEFDTIFRDNEDRISRWVEKLGGGTLGGQFANSGGGTSIPIGVPSIPPSGPAPIKFPVEVENLSASSIGLWSTNGVDAFSQVHLEWDPVTGNTDGSATVPAFYEVWGRPTASSDNTYQRFGVTTATEADVQPFQTGSSWTFRVRAMNSANAPGGYSDSVEHTMTAPSAPMAAPTAPTLSSSLGLLTVNWDGFLTGSVSPPPQFRYVYVEVAPDSSGSPGTYSRMGTTLSRNGRSTSISDLTVGDTYWVRLVAVDGLQVESDPSTAASITIVGVDIGDIDESIGDAIEAANEAARLARGTTNMLNDPSFEANDPTLWSIETADVSNVTTTPRTGTRALRVDSSSSSYVASRYGVPIEVVEGDQYLISAWIRALGSGASVEDGIAIVVEYSADGVTFSDYDDIALSPEVDSTYSQVTGVWVTPAGANYARIAFRVDDDGGTNSYLIDDVSMKMMIPNALIVDGAISADKIGAGEIIAGKLSADAVAASNIQAGAVVTEKLAAGAVTANEIAAETITGDNIAAGTISVTNLEAGIGGQLNISGNVTIVAQQEAIDGVQSDVDGVSGDLTEMRTYYDFGPDGAVISTPDSPFQLKLDNDRISMLELGNEVSYWNAGTMYVRSFVGEEVILGNHKLEKYGTGTVVRRL